MQERQRKHIEDQIHRSKVFMRFLLCFIAGMMFEACVEYLKHR